MTSKATCWGRVGSREFKNFAEFMKWAGFSPAPPMRLFTEEECKSFRAVPPMTESCALQFYRDYCTRYFKEKQVD